MPVKVAAFANCDDAVVFWRIDKAIPHCLGFAVEREMIDKDGKRVRTFIENRTGFTDAPARPGEKRPSSEWPFQRFSWSDHAMDLGDKPRYRVTPVKEDDAGKLSLDMDNQSAWSKSLSLTGDCGDGTACCFNRGLVISQFMARYLADLQKKKGLTYTEALRHFKTSLGDHETPIRRFLSGELRNTLVGVLEDARKTKREVFAALYELGDDELIDALGKLGKRAHVVLANGSVKKNKNGTFSPASKDQNQNGRKRLRAAGVQVHDRMVSPGALGHNKFLVLTSASGTPNEVWTGSTNWTTTGLCTQINNGFRIKSGPIAKIYCDQWKRLRDAEDGFPAELVGPNSKPHKAKLAKGTADVWFTRSKGKVDLAALDAEVNEAKECILFLMFMPGGKGILKTIHDRIDADDSLYVRGVVSDLPRPEKETAVDVSLIGSATIKEKPFRQKIVQPEGIKNGFASWAATVARGSFKANIGNAIVHSKLIVIDPFTRPVVITGSHNFSGAASSKNDENFVIVRGNHELAVSYAIHVLSIYQHYRWPAYVAQMQAQGKSPWSGLSRKPSWQNSHLIGPDRAQMEFWVR